MKSWKANELSWRLLFKKIFNTNTQVKEVEKDRTPLTWYYAVEAKKVLKLHKKSCIHRERSVMTEPLKWMP